MEGRSRNRAFWNAFQKGKQENNEQGKGAEGANLTLLFPFLFLWRVPGWLATRLRKTYHFGNAIAGRNRSARARPEAHSEDELVRSAFSDVRETIISDVSDAAVADLRKRGGGSVSLDM